MRTDELLPLEYPAVDVLIAVARVLHVCSDELLGLKPPPRVVPRRQLADERRLWRHLKLVASVTERDQQRAVLPVIDTAAKAGRSA